MNFLNYSEAYDLLNHMLKVRLPVSLALIFYSKVEEFYNTYVQCSMLDSVGWVVNGPDTQLSKKCKMFRIPVGCIYNLLLLMNQFLPYNKIKQIFFIVRDIKSYGPGPNWVGHLYEEQAIEILKDVHKMCIKHPKILVNPRIPIIVAKPDGLIYKNSKIVQILEIKCPEKTRNMDINDAAWNNMIKGLIRPICRKGRYKLAKWNKVYLQVQLYMLVANVKKAIVVYYSPFNKGSVLKICVNFDKLWVEKKLYQIYDLYYNYCLPIIIKNVDKYT